MSGIAIPYEYEPRPDTGVVNSKLGIWLFLASEVMLFGALFSTYILLRAGSPSWPHGVDEGLSIPLATVNTVVLIVSSWTMVMSYASLLQKKFSAYRGYMLTTVLCGCVFLVIKYFEYTAKFEHHRFPHSSVFLSIYFTMTGLHGLHVIGGIIVNAYHWGPGSKFWHHDPGRLLNRVEVSGLYWHFVDLVWIFLFPLLYLL